MKRAILGLILAFPILMSSTPARAASGGFAPFKGSWYLHGFNLQVTSGGNAYAVYRMYVFCSAHRHYGCDRIVGNNLFSGGLWLAQLSHPGTSQVTGTIVASADTSLDGAGVVLQRQPGDFLLLTWRAHGHQQQIRLCGPKVPASAHACGA
jgi:hypothetical protein